MDILRKYLEKDEEIEANYSCTTGSRFKNYIFGNLIYIVMWIALIGAGIYFTIRMMVASSDYWFIIIPPLGLMVLRIWTIVMWLIKERSEKGVCGYAITNKRVLYYSEAKYKITKSVAFDEIVTIEKSDYIADGFFISSEKEVLHVKDVYDEKDFLQRLTKKVGANKVKQDN